MFRRTVRKILGAFGYDMIKDGQNVEARDGYVVYEYQTADGSFDYEQYRSIQTAANKRKLDYVWVVEDNIRFLSAYLEQRLSKTEFGLCHGTRRGKEQEWFRKYLNCEVLGTEISDTAEEFPHTIQWDFHEVKPEWVGSVDFIYSNSFDHSYDPEQCLDAWMSCVKDHGVCILEHTSADVQANKIDPFGAPISVMPYLILKWGDGEYAVREILEAPTVPELLLEMTDEGEVPSVHYLVIEWNR